MNDAKIESNFPAASFVPPGKNGFGSRFLLASGRFFFRFRNGMFPVVFVALFFLTRPALFLESAAIDRVVELIGILIAMAGQVFRFFVIGYAYIKRGGKDGQVYADGLVIRGVYAHSRNPMYVGNFLIAVGVGIVYGSPWVYFAVIPFFAYVYLSIVVTEESYLRVKFGKAYEEYEKKVNRFIPDFRGLRSSLSGFDYNWKRALRKDYGTLFALIGGLLFISIWKDLYLFGFHERRREILIRLSLVVPFALCYFFVRYLKLTKRLVADSAAND